MIIQQWVLRQNGSHKTANQPKKPIAGVSKTKKPFFKYAYHPLIEEFILNKGIDTEEKLEAFLKCSLSSLKDPYSIDQMEVAVERLLEAKDKNQKVLIYGDYDLDGTPGSLMLKEALLEMGWSDVHQAQPLRLADGYGFKDSIVRRKEDELNIKFDLVVTVDVGITDVASTKVLMSEGVDVLITDHHQPKEILPPAIAILNPHKKEDSSGLTQLCGTGVAFYLIMALRKQLRTNLQAKGIEQDPYPQIKNLLDLVCLATITDLVPLVGDNRVLVKHGLKALENTKRLYLSFLKTSLNMTGKLKSIDVAIRFSPKLNAVSRMEEELSLAKAFQFTDKDDIRRAVTTTLEMQQKRRDIQDQGVQEALFSVEEKWGEDYPDVVYVTSKSFHKGVVGLIAQNVMEATGRACFAGKISKDGKITGSARSPSKKISLVELMEASPSLGQFGGHVQAAGFALKEENSDLFLNQLQDAFIQLNYNHIKESFFDLEADVHQVNTQFMDELDLLEPFGMGFEKPILKIKKCKLSGVKVLKEKHLKLELMDYETHEKRQAIWFQVKKKKINEVIGWMDKPVELLVKTEWNHFNGSKSIQFMVQKIRLAEETAI